MKVLMPLICVTTRDKLTEDVLKVKGFRWCAKDKRFELKCSATSSVYQYVLRMKAQGKLSIIDHEDNPI